MQTRDRGDQNSDNMKVETNALVKVDKISAVKSNDEKKDSSSDSKPKESDSPDKSPKLRLKPLSELKLCPPASNAKINDVEIIPLNELPKDISKTQEDRVNFIPSSVTLRKVLGSDIILTSSSVISKETKSSKDVISALATAASLLTTNTVQKAKASSDIIDLVDDDPPGDTSNDVIQILSDDEYEGNPSGLAKETSVISISSSTADRDMSSTSEQGRFTSKEDKGRENGPLSEANSVVSIRSSTDEELSLPENEIEKEPRPNIPSEVTVEEFLKTRGTHSSVSNNKKPKDTNEKVKPGPSCHRNTVSVSLRRLIQICVKLLTQEEYRTFSRKVSKYLNSLPEESPRFPEVTTYIDAQSEMLKTDPTNVFV